ncbi:MAG TPA: ion channel [Polyangia bacterium]|jgi:inward rectifier potassium channel|nr:ion channel [Polyangia bacterium]
MADLVRDRPAASPTVEEPNRVAPEPPLPVPAIRRVTADRFSRQGVKAIGLKRAPHKDVYHFVLGRTWPSFFLLVALVFILTNMLFAWLYLAEPGSITNARPGSFEDALNFSVQTLATIGYGGMSPASRYGHVIVALEAIVGILMVALITGITFTRFARPTARVLFSNKVVLSPRDGVPHVMFRMANWRRNRIVEARLSAVLLVTERTREGDVMRKQIDLPLVRSKTNVFFLTWSAMHLVDEESPFYGPDALERLRVQQAELYLGLTGFDETIGQTIYVRKQYTLDDIVSDARFADVLSTDENGTRIIDYRKFHDVVPLGSASGV